MQVMTTSELQLEFADIQGLLSDLARKTAEREPSSAYQLACLFREVASRFEAIGDAQCVRHPSAMDLDR